MKRILSLIVAGFLLVGAALAQSPVTVTIKPGTAGPAIPSDFIGLSFGMKVVPPDKTGAHFFSPTNSALITLFQNLGIRHLRVGGTSVESPLSTPIPDEADIGSLFGFVKAAGVQKVIYSFRLLETQPGCNYVVTNAVLAKYIWDKYGEHLDCFAIGNEPDHKRVYANDLTITNFDAYLQRWHRTAAAITRAVPGAVFTGPDACSGVVAWTTNFAHAERNNRAVRIIGEHFYVGAGGRDIPAPKSIDDMLSPGWIARDQRLYDLMAIPVLTDGLPYRFTEANDHYQGGTPDASNAFAGALWALDFLHWWAAHGATGVDFHNTQWVANDVITPGADGRLTATPKGCGLKAFDLGSRGRIESLALSNPDGLNLTAYAVRGDGEYFVTLINKGHGPGAREAAVTFAAPGAAGRAQVIYLTAPDGNAAAKTGVTLGGATIRADSPWLGKWKPLDAAQPGQCMVKVPATSAAIVKIPAP